MWFDIAAIIGEQQHESCGRFFHFCDIENGLASHFVVGFECSLKSCYFGMYV